MLPARDLSTPSTARAGQIPLGGATASSLTQPAENTNEPLQSGRQTVFLRLPRRSNHLVINTHSVLIAGVFFALFP